jgi:hypothetical protein
MDERRRDQRHDRVFPAEVRRRGGDRSTIGLVADVSSGGLLLRADAPQTPGETLELTVVLPPQAGIAREVPIEARVRWCEPDIAPGTHVIGLAFIGATPPDGPAAMNLLRQLKGTA